MIGLPAVKGKLVKAGFEEARGFGRARPALNHGFLRLTEQGGSSDEIQPPANSSFWAFGLIFLWRHFGGQDHPGHKKDDYR